MLVQMGQNHGSGRRASRQRGAALVEFAFVALLLFGLVFGIISYAYMMSFRQAITQAAAEGARAGALAVPSPSNTTARADALAAVNQAIGGYTSGGSTIACGQNGLTCQVTFHPGDPARPGCPAAPSRTVICITVSYPYRSRPMLPSFPGLGLTLPSSLTFTSIAEINNR